MSEHSKERAPIAIRALGVSQSLLGGTLITSGFVDVLLSTDTSFSTSWVKAVLGGVFLAQGIKNARGK